MQVRMVRPKELPVKSIGPEKRPPLRTMASAPDRILDIVHVSSEAANQSFGDNPVMTLAHAGVSAASLYLGVKAIQKPGFVHKTEGTMLLAMGVGAGLTAASGIVGGHLGESLGHWAKPFDILHGAADVVLGVHGIQEAREKRDGAMLAVSGLEVAVGAAIIGANFTGSSLSHGLTLAAFGAMAVKQAIIQTH